MIRVKRADRVGCVIQKELSNLLATKIKDPRLDMVTITAVKITDDLRAARVYVSVAEGKARMDSVLCGFRSAQGFLRRALGGRLGLRYVPTLTFVYDESFDRADSLSRIFKALNHEPFAFPE
ncbi:MAG: 30S ribosome-binding factor RbfA [Deltaproteobacteria bacterium]|nr:30S ribosome-binding factor RbfA [Deltaproteobacteria bacterium]